MKKLLESCDHDLVMLDLPAPTLETAVRNIIGNLNHRGIIQSAAVPQILNEPQRKEKLSASAIGHSLAVPHAYLDCLEKLLIAQDVVGLSLSEGEL